MKILLTGASSFTGYWFATQLVSAGHEVVATFQGPPGSYTGVRGERVAGVSAACRAVHEVSFGTPAFVGLIEGESEWDVLCHHGADVTNYKSSDFDTVGALARNTHGSQPVLEVLVRRGCSRVVLTGSVFENDEGVGSGDGSAFSLYGLSKGLTWQVFRFQTQSLGMQLGKFVIPNPFGPFEEARFTQYLVRTWMKGEPAGVNTPAYVRDNIHVSLLARAYVDFVQKLSEAPGLTRINPSGYVESQGAFALRFAREMQARLDLRCEVELAEQVEFAEPKMRINTDVPDYRALEWDEGRAWDDIAEYYVQALGCPRGQR